MYCNSISHDKDIFCKKINKQQVIGKIMENLKQTKEKKVKKIYLFKVSDEVLSLYKDFKCDVAFVSTNVRNFVYQAQNYFAKSQVGIIDICIEDIFEQLEINIFENDEYNDEEIELRMEEIILSIIEYYRNTKNTWVEKYEIV